MSGFAKWIGGGLGWALGGPIGALIGFAIGSFIGAKLETVEKSQNRRTTTTSGDFKISLLVLIACMMKADGHPKKSELEIVKRFLVNNFGEEGALEALSILKNLLEKDIDERQVAEQIYRYTNYSTRLELIHLLFDIAYADHQVSTSELTLIERIAGIFRISGLDFESLKAPYIKQVDINWAYKALEIEPSASVDEIKKAYRKMAMKYHPDKVNTLGEDVKKKATEKFRSINEAYETLKMERKFT